MAIEDSNVVDAIGLDNKQHIVVLTISDHLVWDDDAHLEKLQDKLNCYLSFIESGELVDSYPEADGLKVRISLVCKYPPTDEAIGFLSKVQSIALSSGIEFEYNVFSDNG